MEHHYSAGGLRIASVVEAVFARELERDLNAAKAEAALVRVDIDRIRVEVEQRTTELDKANAKVTELSTVCEAQQSLILTRNKTLDVIIEKLETANTKIKTLESEVNKLEDEINVLYYQ
jgi:chromosome segregation ATPase